MHIEVSRRSDAALANDNPYGAVVKSTVILRSMCWIKKLKCTIGSHPNIVI